MKKGMSDYEFFCALTLFLAGGVTVVGHTSGWRDDWLIHMALPVFSLPLMLVFVALARRGRAEDVMRQAFGDIAGEVVLLAMSGVALLVSASVLNVYVDYIAMTPVLTVNRPFAAAAMGVMCYAIAMCPLGGIARLCRILLPLALLLLVFVIFIAAGEMDFRNLLPIAQPGAKALGKDMWRLLLLQTAPAFFFVLQAAPASSGQKWPRAAMAAVLAIALFIGLDRMKNLTLIGWPLISSFRYPANAATSALELGDLFERFEFLTSSALAMCQPISAALCIRFAGKKVLTIFTRLHERVCVGVMTAAVVIISALPGAGHIIELMPWYSGVMAIFLVLLPVSMLALVLIGEKMSARG